MRDNKSSSAIIYLLAFTVPVIVMTLCFALLEVWPFGNNTVMTGDTTYQFVDYLSYLKTVFFGNNDLSYTLSKNLGGEMAGFSAYYFYSPLNLLTLPFPSEYLPVGIGLILILAPGLCSLSLCFALSRLYGTKPELLIFSYAYGLMAHLVVYNEIFENYTNLALLPLVYLGLVRMTEKKKPDILYIFTLALTIINNYYTGYMICIFLVLYTVYLVALDTGRIRAVPSFIISSACAGGLAAFTLLPAVLSLSGEKNKLSLGFFALFNPLDFFSKFYTGSFKGDFGMGLPNIYCGIFIVLLLILYFMNKKISIRERVITGLFILFFIANFCINTFNVVWHGFNRPIGFPHRFAFLFVFFIIIVAYDSFSKLENAEPKKGIIVSFAVFAVYSVYVIISKNANTSVRDVIISLAVLTAASIVLVLGRKNGVFLLIIIEIIDLGINAELTLREFDLTKMDEFQSAYHITDELVSKVKESDDSLYRMEKYFRRSHNDAFMHDYAGISHFSSCFKHSTTEYLGKLGFRDNGNWAYYSEGSTAFADSFLGVKYLLSQYNSTGKPYGMIYETGEGHYIFNDPYALPLLFASDDAVYDISYEDYDDPFMLQEDIADGITGDENEIFRPIPVRRVYEDGQNCMFEFTTERDGIVEAYFTAPSEQKVKLIVNGNEQGNYFDAYRWNVLDLGVHKKGETIEIGFASADGNDIRVNDAYIYNEDFDSLGRFYDKVSKNKSSLTKITSSHYIGEAELSGVTELVFSVPCEEGWRAYVDGQRTETRVAAGDLLGISAGEGKHTLEFKYVPPGRTAGIIISLIALAALTVYVLYRRKAGEKMIKKN